MNENKVRRDAFQGISWTALTKILHQLFNFIFLVFLARILGPEEFGMLSMIIVFTGVADLIKDFGLSSAIIHRIDLKDTHLNTAFWFNIFVSIVLTFSYILFAPYIASFYNEPKLKQYIYAFSSIFIISSLNIVQNSLIIKNLNFKKLFLIDSTCVFLSGTIAVCLAYNAFGTWSLIIQIISFYFFNVILMWLSSNWKPKFQFSLNSLRELFNYSSGLFGYQMLNYFSRHIDQLLIGKYLTSANLGIYSRTYQLMLLPINTFNVIVTRVMFPILSREQNNLQRFAAIYLKSVKITSMIMFPISIAIYLFSEDIVYTVFGIKWIKMVPLLRIFFFIVCFNQ